MTNLILLYFIPTFNVDSYKIPMSKYENINIKETRHEYVYNYKPHDKL